MKKLLIINKSQALALIGGHERFLPKPGEEEVLIEPENVKLGVDDDHPGYYTVYGHRANDVQARLDSMYSSSKGSICAQAHKDYEVGVNLMQQDFSHMGQAMSKNVFCLFATHATANMEYLIVVNTETGESIKLTFTK